MNYSRVRKVIEATYTDRCTVMEHKKTINKETKLAGWEDVEVLKNQPCRLSFQAVKSTQQEGSAETMVQSVKLFVSPGIAIKEGSKVTVTREGREFVYVSSGVPALYPTHQEIMLELFKGWA